MAQSALRAYDILGALVAGIDAGADEILFICQMGTVPNWAQLETLKNIGEKVIPYFRSRQQQDR